MLKTLICDDEQPALELLADMLGKTGEIELVASCASGQEAISIINEGGIDLAFFDVEMPELTGVEAVLNIEVDPKPLLIFATAHPEYAVEAFGIDAIDYVLKPFDERRISKAVGKATRMLRLIRETDQKDTQLNVVPAEDAQTDIIRIKDGGAHFFVPLEEIMWVEAAGDYSLLHKSNGELAVRRTISSLEAELPEQRFLRVHRSAIVSIEHVAQVQRLAKGKAEITLKEGTTIQSSRSYRDAVFDMLG